MIKRCWTKIFFKIPDNEIIIIKNLAVLYLLMLVVSQLFIYPVKSLGGISVSSATVTEKGFQHDRRWMLVDKNLRFLTQREFPLMALLQVELTKNGLKVYHKEKVNCSIVIPFIPESSEPITVQIFDETCEALFANSDADKWFTEMLDIDCSLVFMPDTFQRFVDKKYALHNETTGFADAFPFMIIGQASVDDLNKKLPEALPMNRFRPSIVFTGGEPYEEDLLRNFMIQGISFYGVKLCARCVIPTINQDNANKSKEPLKTLALYRQKNNKIYFGQNLLVAGTGTISIGDQIEVLEINQSKAFLFSDH
ncbi:MAG: MOSC N-terminal beta barrel domain-containing protein [Ginsengibacter sp.]